eukprot:5750481-Amphidinium_carterae.1
MSEDQYSAWLARLARHSDTAPDSCVTEVAKVEYMLAHAWADACSTSVYRLTFSFEDLPFGVSSWLVMSDYIVACPRGSTTAYMFNEESLLVGMGSAATRGALEHELAFGTVSKRMHVDADAIYRAYREMSLDCARRCAAGEINPGLRSKMVTGAIMDALSELTKMGLALGPSGE